MTQPQFFKTQDDFRDWLEENHAHEKELLVGFWKVGSGKRSMSWSESVDQALCFGWIDGVRKRVDDDSYTIRFTPRRATSIWSKINIDKVAVLMEKGLMYPAGLAAYEKKNESRAMVYAYENAPKELDAELVKEFKKDKAAWKFFEALPPSFHKLMIHWVMSAKQEKTRRARFEKLVVASREGKRL
ncbi:MAG: YdeI/OmpD-associated family protein [Pyrinomonadaceae bacterium]